MSYINRTGGGFGDDRVSKNFNKEVARREKASKPTDFFTRAKDLFTDRFDKPIANSDKNRLALVNFHKPGDVGFSDPDQSGSIRDAIKQRTFTPELVAQAKQQFMDSAPAQYRNLFTP